jgi:hypothetical protein
LDLNETHGGGSNNFSFIHKGVSHVLKLMIKSTIMAKSFPTLRKKKKKYVPTPIPKDLVQAGHNDMNITVPTTVASNTINHIHIEFKTFSVELMRDNENNMIPMVPSSIKIKGKNFIKRVTGPIMPKPRIALLQGRG